MESIKAFIINRIKSSKFNKKISRIAKYFVSRSNFNLNLDLTKHSQKRVLFCYLNPLKYDFDNVSHANILHANQMISTFIKLGFVIDVCNYDDLDEYDTFKNKRYDILIGFGQLYKRLVSAGVAEHNVLFLTENIPIVVAEKYKERLAYFKLRHPDISIKYARSRNYYYDQEMIDISSSVIMMSSKYNASYLNEVGKKYTLVNVNSIVNPRYVFSDANISTSRTNFVVFGCNGLVHKGLDVLIDVFKDYKNLNLNIYGLGANEIHLLKSLQPSSNVRYCGVVNVHSSDFIDHVVSKNQFVILNSCSEGMASGVATCMCHGMIGIVTKECGFEEDAPVIVLDGYHVEDIKTVINDLLQKSDNEIALMQKKSYEYASINFSLSHFSELFENSVTTLN